MIVTVTYQNEFGPKYNAASIKTPCKKVNEALEYAFAKTQNVFYNWSEREIEGVDVCYHKFDGSPLRSSMVGDEFTVWAEDDISPRKFICDRVGWKEVA